MQNRIFELRIERGWRQSDLAKKIEQVSGGKIATSRISLYERGIIEPTPLVQVRFAKAFDLKREDIFLPANVTKKGK